MTIALVWILVALLTESPTLAVVAAFGFWMLMVIAKAALVSRRSA